MESIFGAQLPRIGSTITAEPNVAIKTEIEFACRTVKLTKALVDRAVQTIAGDYGWKQGEISITIVDDPTIHRLNREYLEHDYPTDVISFDTTERKGFLEGEVIASGDTANRIASENGWNASHELLLYLVHGMLHIVGLDDTTATQANRMRREERHYMEHLVGDVTVCQEDR